MPIPSVLLFSVVVPLLVSCGADPDARSESGRGKRMAPLVEAVPARTGALPLVERLSGTVRAENQVALYPEISGRISEVMAETGNEVRKGEVLVALSDQQYREQLRQAEAGYRINEARVRQARARLSELEARASRTKSLGEQNLVSEVELDQLAAQMESAAADVALAEAQLEEAAANLAERRELLDRTAVVAPIDGVVGERNAEVGMQVTPSTRLFTIGNLERVTVDVDITDNMVRRIQTGHPVDILTQDGSGGNDVLHGEITRISPFLNEITRSASAEIEIDNRELLLRPGMFVAVDVHYGQSRQSTLIPVSALFTHRDTGNVGVFVLDAAPVGDEAPTEDGADPLRSVTFRPAEIIARGDMEVAVNNIQPGEWVVTLGQGQFAGRYDEVRIKPVTWQHVMLLQGLKREDLLSQILPSSSAGE